MPIKNYCPQHNALSEDIRLIRQATIKNTDTLEAIQTNHLAHLQTSYEALARDLWKVKNSSSRLELIVGGGIAIIAILVGLFGAIISMNMAR